MNLNCNWASALDPSHGLLVEFCTVRKEPIQNDHQKPLKSTDQCERTYFTIQYLPTESCYQVDSTQGSKRAYRFECQDDGNVTMSVGTNCDDLEKVDNPRHLIFQCNQACPCASPCVGIGSFITKQSINNPDITIHQSQDYTAFVDEKAIYKLFDNTDCSGNTGQEDEYSCNDECGGAHATGLVVVATVLAVIMIFLSNYIASNL